MHRAATRQLGDDHIHQTIWASVTVPANVVRYNF